MARSPLFALTRREVILTGAAAAALLPAEDAFAQAAAAPAGIRPDIATPAGSKMVDLYAHAVAAMQDPAINYPPRPSSWLFQSYIHSVPINPFDPANSGGLRNGTPAMKRRIDEIYGQPAAGSPAAAWKQAAIDCWGTCTHSSPYFPIWHRWYMYYFERICRDMCKDASFQLPYWNYASDAGSSLQLPAQFREPAAPPFPQVLLFDDRGLGFANPAGAGDQNVAMNLGGYMPLPQVEYDTALQAKVMFPSDVNFAAPPSTAYAAFGFSGRLECVPHDMVHDHVGGWMGNVPSAAGDPVFYMHHCQIDRLYASWEAGSGVSYNWGGAPTDPDKKTWENRAAFFVDEKGKIVKVKMGDAVDTAALGYKYDGLATVVPAAPLVAAAAPLATAAPAIKLAAMRAGKFTVGGGGSSVTLIPGGAQPLVAGAPPVAGAAAGPATLVLDGITLLRRPPAPLSVFVNLPAGAPRELNGPYYAGTLNLFNFDLATGMPMAHAEEEGGQAMHDMHGAKASFDIAGLLARQRSQGLWSGGSVTVTVATIGADKAAPVVYLKVESVEVVP